MPTLTESEIVAYLSRAWNGPVRVRLIGTLGDKPTGQEALKAFGYGKPLFVDFETEDGATRRLVLRQVQRNGFGREMSADRAAAVWLDFHAFSDLPRHVHARDMVGLDDCGRLTSLGPAQELVLVTDYAPGTPYASDLARIRDDGALREGDLARAEALARYLAGIHATRHDDPLLWRRRLRDLVGHGEGIMGLADSYPSDFPLISGEQLCRLEQMAVAWRWRLKPRTHRLSQVHGDFHPFNILFTENETFYLIDRSRGPWGEPADDLTALSINYIFFSLQRNNRLDGAFGALYERFWETYEAVAADEELPEVVQPWFAWRALVLASPQWYRVEDEVRLRLLRFAFSLLESDAFDWRETARYLEIS
jgi:hypothetical protein